MQKFFSFKNVLQSIFVLIVTISVQCSSSKDDDPQPEPPPIKRCSTCTYIVPEGKGTIDGQVLGIKPGDTICLNAALKYNGIIFKNIVGTEAKPIIITNCDGTVNMKVTNLAYDLVTSYSKYFRLTGGDTEGYFGIQVSGAKSTGVSLHELSTNFEVDHIEVSDVGFAGIMAKTDPKCDNDATLRGNFTMRNVSIHDNYVHDTGGEGFYLGHSFYPGYDTDCGTLLPHTIEGIDVYNNHVVRSGWDGIQLSCATKDAAVFGNTVEDYAVANEIYQMNGIILGSGTGGLCYGNIVNRGTGIGICIFGLGNNVIHDNIIMNTGDMGMFCDERGSVGPGIKFVNNTIINPAKEGVRIYTETFTENVFINNVVINPGSYDQYGEKSYLMLLKGVTVAASNNYFTRDIGEAKFVDPAGLNFRLQGTSPAVDKGKDISTYNIASDFYKATRLKGAAYDIGASELQ